ncbi:MAG: ABC transporter permease [Oscillospiraceae bacterium]|nr:ABC transporter permease [Oscillospiraceae bacterium]
MRTKGWEKILKFTYIQIIKSKSYIASTVIMLVVFSLMIAAANFLPGLLSSESEVLRITDDEGNTVAEMEAFAIKKVYICDSSGLRIDFSFLSRFEVEHESIADEEVQEFMDSVTTSLEAVTLAVIEPSGGGFNVRMSRPESTELINNSDCFALLNLFNTAIRDSNLVNLGISAEDVHKANAYISTTVNVGGEEPQSEIAEVITMVLTMATSLILFTLIISYGQLTAQAIATEKASRVMELLLTSVRPLAVIIGKVLGTLLVALTSMVLVGTVSTVVFFVFAPLGTLGEVVGMVDTSDPNLTALTAELGTVFSGFSPLNIVFITVIFVMGFLFYSLIAGLIGASVSKIEDLQTALQPLILISMLGFYLTYFSTFTGLDPDGQGNFLVTLSRYFPISSPFALPSAIIAGKMSVGEITLSIGVLALCLALFAMFVAKVYEHIILHNGNRLKLKDMIKLAKSK